jgi:hypothetical protein
MIILLIVLRKIKVVLKVLPENSFFFSLYKLFLATATLDGEKQHPRE